MATLSHAYQAAAQRIDPPFTQTVIGDGVLSNSSGSIAVNVGAGVGNAQANMVAISVGDGNATSATLRNRQQVTLTEDAAQRRERSEIGAGAFRDASGILTVNQSSGNGNVQANLVAVAMGKMAEASIDQLSQASAPQKTQDAGSASTGRSRAQEAAIADSAFAGVRGIVQVNQSAGSRNNTTNVFTLSVGVGYAVTK